MKKKSKNILLSKKFFERSTNIVAQELLGKFLVRKIGAKEIAVMITETEAYDGPHDKASHAHRGRTKRNEPMFGNAGVWYVYLCYGVHEMLNIVTGPRQYPAAVLIRGVEGANGPGKVTKMLKIGRTFNNKKSVRANGLWIEDRGVRVAPRDIRHAARIGVAYAGPVWSRKKYRYILKIKSVTG